MIINYSNSSYDASNKAERETLLAAIKKKKSAKLEKPKLEKIVKQIEEADLNIHEKQALKDIYTNAGGLQDITSELIEDGEASFQALYGNLLTDMQQYTGNIDLLIEYSSLVVNLFIHAATYTPVEGHGKAQKREYNHKTQLEYYRSQGEHPNAKLFRGLSGTSGANKSRLPLNAGFLELLEDNYSKNFCKEIKKIDPDNGVPIGKVNSQVITKIAHAGARRNNLYTIRKGMKIVVEDKEDQEACDALKAKLEAILSPTKKIKNLKIEDCNSRIQALLKRCKQAAKKQTETDCQPRLSSTLLDYRVQRIKSLQKKVEKLELKKISPTLSQGNATFLSIRLYPDCKEHNDTYKEGVTNVLLSFFGAMLNHNAKKKGLSLHTERRQSFGFLRPTLTDAGLLTLRLSLGLEPTSFDVVVLESLEQLDKLLIKFDFEKPNHKAVKQVFEIKPPIKPKKKPSKINKSPDTYIRNIVRKDDRTLTTYRQAECYINKACNDHKPNYLEVAMERFLTDYVYGSKKLEETTLADSPKPSICETGSSASARLLKSIVSYGFHFAAELEFLKSDAEPLAEFSHCYLHSLLKLYNNLEESRLLLDDVEKMEATAFYQRATLLAENTLEYLVSLNELKQIRSSLQGKPLDPIQHLRETEINYFAKSVDVNTKRVDLFFTDSGQQAIITSLLVLPIMLQDRAKDGNYYDEDIHLFGKTYFEVQSFMKDVKNEGGLKDTASINNAKIIFADITEVHQVPWKKCSAMQALIIDITHHPLLDDKKLTDKIVELRKQGIWVILVESSLKHQQLGLDKYQSGKIITISPINETLQEDVKSLFDMVSEDAINPSIASYLQIVNEICRDKLPATSKECTSKGALAKAGLFKKPEVAKPNIPPVNVTRRVEKRAAH